MKQIPDISQKRNTLATMVELTSSFKGIASMHISQTKDQVLNSQKFFDDLWRIYQQIRVDDLFHFGRQATTDTAVNKELIVIITAEGSFSGDIDHRLIEEMLKYYKPDKHDIIVIGRHGAIQLTQVNVPYKRSFKLPDKPQNIDATPIVKEIERYSSTIIYYQVYKSLTVQEIGRLPLSAAVAERGKQVTVGDQYISEENFIFEPSTFAVVDHLERSMTKIVLSQLILDSKLAQYASRFKAMTEAHDRAKDTLEELELTYKRARRAIKDERLKEVLYSLKKVRQ